jgi:hypothetical protein
LGISINFRSFFVYPARKPDARLAHAIGPDDDDDGIVHDPNLLAEVPGQNTRTWQQDPNRR